MVEIENIKAKNNKLKYLEGIRGVAAFIVILHHLRCAFCFNFDKTIYLSILESTHSQGFANFVHSILNILLDGNLAVYIFWFMSGYVISIRLFTSESKTYLVGAFTKRYTRLAIPALCSILVAFFLMRFQWMYNVQLSHIVTDPSSIKWLGERFNFDPNFFKAIKSAVWGTFFQFTEPSYNSSLWTMNPELYGSLFCFALFGVFGTSPKRCIFYALIFAIAFKLYLFWLLAFLLGFYVCDLDFSENKFKKYIALAEEKIFSKAYISVPLFIATLVLGGQKYNLGYFNMVISFCLVFIVMKSPLLKRMFELKPIVWLGKVSFSFYLIHLAVLCSLGCYLYLVLPYSHITKIIIASLATIVTTYGLAVLFTKYIDDTAVRLSNKIGNYFSK